MSILCAITSLLQLVILLALTGVLVSIAAVSRLMEVSISLIHPLTLFLLRQSGKLVIWSVKQSARLTSRAFSKMCTMDCFTDGTARFTMTQPEIDYSTTAWAGLTALQETTEVAGDAVQPFPSQVEGEDADQGVKEEDGAASAKEEGTAEGVNDNGNVEPEEVAAA